MNAVFFVSLFLSFATTTTVFTAISLLFINKIQIKFLLSAYFYFDYTFFFVLQFFNFYERSHCMNVFISYWALFVFSFIFSSSISLRFDRFSCWFLHSFALCLDLFLLCRCYRRSGVGPFFKPLDSLWFGQLLYFILMVETHIHTKNTNKTKKSSLCAAQKRNEMVRFIEFIERVPLWLLSYQRMNRNQIQRVNLY